MALPSREVRLDRLEVAAYVIPTDGPESDGTYEWDSTTLVLAKVEAKTYKT